jgi:hypothetical protein
MSLVRNIVSDVSHTRTVRALPTEALP